MNKEIIFFCPSIEDGGVEKNLYLLANKLLIEFKTSIITANKEKKKKFNNKINFLYPKKENLQNSPRLLKSIYCLLLGLKYLINKNKPSVLISYESNIFAIIMAKILRISIIVRSNASPEGYLNNYFKIFIFKFFFNFADVVLVNSSEFKKKIDKILNINSKIIYNSIIDKSLQNRLSQKKIKKYKTKKNCYKIIVIGRLVDQKDQITILKALNHLKNKLDFFVLVVGKGDKKKKLKKFCLENKISNKVKFLGYKDNIYPYLKWSDALVLSSKYEGSPNVLIEAISMNKIVISSDCPTGPREILKNGKGGFLFKTSDYKDLANKIGISFFNKKITNKKIKFSSQSIGRFSIERNKDEFVKIIKSLK